MNIQPTTREAYWLFHEGQRVLSRIEQHGILIDRKKAESGKLHLTRQIDRMQKKLEDYPEVREWKRIYGNKFNPNSDAQLRHILFEVLKLKSTSLTKGGKAQVSKAVLQDIDLPFIQDMMEISKLRTVRDTFLSSIIREADDDDLIHPNFGLTNVSTFRGSADHPNFQNMPIRDPVQSAPIRQLIIPREGFQIGEADCSGVEVRIAATYHHDPTMLEYLRDDSTDMHRDTAMECFLLDQEQVTKEIRYCAKNMFVFPQFYGDWYKTCAETLWKAVKRMRLTTEDGIPLYDHLTEQGIKSLAKFESHIEDVEDRFWNEWFPVYTQWKKDWYAQYLRDGYFITKTGFRIAGELGKNQVINFPIQGDAFHCLLQALIWVSDTLEKEQWQTHLLGQIHDSMVSEIHPTELEDFYHLVEDNICHRLPEEWTWINVPMKFDMEVAPVGKSWFEKKEYKPK